MVTATALKTNMTSNRLFYTKIISFQSAGDQGKMLEPRQGVSTTNPGESKGTQEIGPQ